eukprot:CAMPEP_0184648982 /NCGR_PEP_ID=MMETSP0308-20130426/6254_1 /TAXON_ID=38269 /ORGANISM="Gloeochaete witrockiana, Strain SAG 46.84" /LENGTH=561 /DNA_ID=CAMNT_0027081339 /DNA_START=326 /DNA_END=2011 /DNA_ORIENTATION=-
MSPFEHGEVFVLDDGGEVDLDLGNYERFLDVKLNRDNNITTGKIYQQVLEKERRGDYLGKTVQVVPHITDAIHDWISHVSSIPVDGASCSPDVCVIELGGTVGDIESMPFVESLRAMVYKLGAENFCFVHVSLVPVVGVVGEPKTKPTQHGVRELRASGINPDIIACRSEQPLSKEIRAKLGMYCQVPPDSVLSVHDVSNIYRVPLLLEAQNATNIICKKLGLSKANDAPRLKMWKRLADLNDTEMQEVRIAIVGKYTGLADSYLSILRALQHAALGAERKLVVEWIDATCLEPATKTTDANAHKAAWSTLKAVDGILVPGGFGDRGVEGKILAVNYARINKRPYLGICLGMQVAVIEFARNMLNMPLANSTEFNSDTPNPVVLFMPEISRTHMGGTMRLGSRRTLLKTRNCLTSKLYENVDHVDERHRHRYEVNPSMVDQLEAAGLRFVGKDETETRMEVVELDRQGHPYFVACQFHPEFTSRPFRPSPLFFGLILAASNQLESTVRPFQNRLKRKAESDLIRSDYECNGSSQPLLSSQELHVNGSDDSVSKTLPPIASA